MQEYALVSPDGEILERTVLKVQAVPSPDELAPHKPCYLRIEQMAPPPHVAGAEVLQGPTLEIDRAAGVVREVWSVKPASAQQLAQLKADKIAAIKAEAERRIVEVMPEHRQRNSLALGMEMVTTHGPDPAEWPAEMRARYEADVAAWGQIKAIRARSDELEAELPLAPVKLAQFDPSTADWDA